MQSGNGFRPFFIPFFWLYNFKTIFFCWGWIWPATPFGWYFVNQIFLPFWCFHVFPIINCSQEWSSRMTNLWPKAYTFVDQASQNRSHNFDIGLNKHVLRKCPSYFILLPLVLSYCPTYLSIFSLVFSIWSVYFSMVFHLFFSSISWLALALASVSLSSCFFKWTLSFF